MTASWNSPSSAWTSQEQSSTCTSRFNPEGPVGATHVHGITDADVARAPYFRDVAPTIAASIAGLPIVAHNANFDLAFLRTEFAGAGWDLPWLPSYCTLNASHLHLPDMDRRRLIDCCWTLGIQLQDAHSALGDARATAGLLSVYLGTAVDGSLTSVRAEAAETAWPAGPTRPPLTSEDRLVNAAVRPVLSGSHRLARSSPR
ncbi:3'-5' exonuclease [Frondihabitans australicus]|uniref:3'-5' exonuclease n=1 Tax=Frondihabitans australicus TaxID=386892 RepID=UPI002482BD42|nr:3'-5' exonuclease [Frondihabitans australicus]